MNNYRLRMLREQAGLTLREVSDKIGVAISTINMYESGNRTPSPKVYKKYADYFKVSVDYLMGETDDVKPVELGLNINKKEYSKLTETQRKQVERVLRTMIDAYIEENEKQ